MVTHVWPTTDDMALVPSDGFHPLSCYNSVLRLLASPHLSFSMGRSRWTTPEQFEFLHSYTDQLAEAKTSTGLNVLYETVTLAFQTHWKAEPRSPFTHPGKTESELAALGVVRLGEV